MGRRGASLLDRFAVRAEDPNNNAHLTIKATFQTTKGWGFGGHAAPGTLGNSSDSRSWGSKVGGMPHQALQELGLAVSACDGIGKRVKPAADSSNVSQGPCKYCRHAAAAVVFPHCGNVTLGGSIYEI